MEDILKPVYVAPIVAYLCHEDCQDTGGVFEVNSSPQFSITAVLLLWYCRGSVNS